MAPQAPQRNPSILNMAPPAPHHCCFHLYAEADVTTPGCIQDSRLRLSPMPLLTLDPLTALAKSHTAFKI